MVKKYVMPGHALQSALIHATKTKTHKLTNVFLSVIAEKDP